MSAAQKLIEWRGERSREDVARLAGVSGVTWWRWEEERSPVALPLVPKVSKLTGIAPADLRPDIFGMEAAE